MKLPAFRETTDFHVKFLHILLINGDLRVVIDFGDLDEADNFFSHLERLCNGIPPRHLGMLR